MTDQNTVTNNQILYAQAMQIALTLSGQKQNFNPTFPMESMVDNFLESHKNLANQVYAFLRSQHG